eukprot:Nitzschia sp. Nitz4//scaffold104_size75438//19509//26698//NITZ4_005654-RA/size75438-processed-gene-0.27-mRNA-1//1//CDS//3329532380//1221//frame0
MFSFGGTPAGAPANSGPSTSSALVPSTTSASAPSAATPAPATPAAAPGVAIPAVEDCFGNFALHHRIVRLSRQQHHQQQQPDAAWMQELSHLLQSPGASAWGSPKMPEWTPPNAQLRQQLMSNATVTMSHGLSTTLTPKVLRRVLDLSTDLRISEPQAVCLYAHVTQDAQALEPYLIPTYALLRQAGLSQDAYTLPAWKARAFYFYERHLQLQTLLLLVQSRLSHASYCPPTDAWLQQGFITNLIQLIRDYSQRITQLMHELSLAAAPTTTSSSTSSKDASPPPFAKVHLLFAIQERHIATEILFFLAYHTQWTSTEIVSLVQLLKDLSAQLPPLCPFTQVPTPYKDVPPELQAASWTTSTTNGAHQPRPWAPLQEKDPFHWQLEFASTMHESGQPQLLQCTSLLLVTAMATLATSNDLWDRQTHKLRPGNALFPPDAMSPPPAVEELHALFHHDAVAAWQRPDLAGWLTASFVLLLQTSPSLLASPRASGVSPTDAKLRQAARSIHTPADLHSFSFARHSLLPALQRLPASQRCVVSEFALSVLSETYASYLELIPEGHLPMSRRRWKLDEEEQLRLRRDDQERARQFMAWQNQGGLAHGGSKSSSMAEEVIPTSVDLMSRPDCLDDLVALAASICHLGPEYTRPFYAEFMSAEGKITRVPCRTLQELEQGKIRDNSLLPCYLTWLAAMANDPVSAQMVHTILSRSPEPDASLDSLLNASHLINWVKVIYNLRWYAQELSPYEDQEPKVSTSTSTTTSSNQSTTYYYNLEGAFQNGGSNKTSSTTTTTTTSGGSSSSPSKPKELSDDSRFHVSSYLALLQNVARHCTAARYAILAVTLTVGGSNAGASTTTVIPTGGDEALLVLFKLAIAPLSPVLRGATLATIANLLRPSSQDSTDLDRKQREFLLEQAKHGWEYLESCPLLPISLLDQYQVAMPQLDSGFQGLAFPPSSATLAGSGTIVSVLPKDTKYGLLYELEQVECRMGWYPSTEGCLELLEALVASAGCPSALGSSLRLRTGVAPYVEYVVEFVLPRVLGIHSFPVLPFRVRSDQSRLLSKALSVVEAVLVRYSVPKSLLKGGSEDPLTVLGLPGLAESLILKDASATEQDLLNDFKNVSANVPSPTDDTSSQGIFVSAGSNTSTTAAPAAAPTSVSRVPMAKSPGFAILADMLSPSAGTLFQAVAVVLTDHGGAKSIESVFGAQTDNMALAYALFGRTPPTLDSAKEGFKEGGPTKPKQALLKALASFPQGEITSLTDFDDGVATREQSISLALRIVCATAMREDAFARAVNTFQGTLKIVPTLRFQQIRMGSANLKASEVAVSKLSSLLFSANNSQWIRSCIVEYIGYRATDDRRDSALASMALSSTYFMVNRLPPGRSVRDFCGHQSTASFCRHVATRLMVAARRPQSPKDIQTTLLVFEWILSSLRTENTTKMDLVQLLLGLPSMTQGGNWVPNKTTESLEPVDVFDAILDLLQDYTWAHSDEAAPIVSSCFETIFRLYNLLKGSDALSMRVVLYTAERLRADDFWQRELLGWLSTQAWDKEHLNPHSLHCLAWLLKGLACEANLMAGFSGNSFVSQSGFAELLSPREQAFHRLLKVLFGAEGRLVHHLVTSLPLKKLTIDPTLVHPPTDVLRMCVEKARGPSDVFAGYDYINEAKVATLVVSMDESAMESMKRWCCDYNALVQLDCASSHIAAATYDLLQSVTTSAKAFAEVGVDHSYEMLASSLVEVLNFMTRSVLEGDMSSFMDANLYPSATRNLSNAILVFAEMLSTLGKDQRPGDADLLGVAGLLSHAIVYSLEGSEASNPIQDERTAVLGTSLSITLQCVGDTETYLLNQRRGDFVLAAKALAKLACCEVSPSSSDSRTAVALLARSTLSTVLEVCADTAENKSESFIIEAFGTSQLRDFVSLVSRKDSNICSVLRSAALQPFGAVILLDAGICEAIETAADSYRFEEKQYMDGRGALVSDFNSFQVKAPDYLLGHLGLLSALMATTSDSFQQSLSRRVIRILSCYLPVFKRLCCNFPSEADVLRAFVRCLEQAVCIDRPADLDKRNGGLSLSSEESFKDLFKHYGFLDNGLLMVCQHLMEYPLPRDLLPPLPQSLQEKEPPSKTGVVKVQSDNSRTWWDVLDALLETKQASFSFRAPIGSNDFGYWGQQAPGRWNENHFEYAIAAASILRMGLSVLKKLNLFDRVRGKFLAAGVYEYTLASQSIRNRLDELSPFVGGGAMFSGLHHSDTHDYRLEVEYLKSLGREVSQCAEQLVIASNTVAGDLQESDRATWTKQLQDAVEQSGLNNKGLGFLGDAENNNGSSPLVKALTARILKDGKNGSSAKTLFANGDKKQVLALTN